MNNYAFTLDEIVTLAVCETGKRRGGFGRDEAVDVTVDTSALPTGRVADRSHVIVRVTVRQRREGDR